MSKNKKYPGSMKAYLVCGIAVIAAASIFTISSCKKEAATVESVATISNTPPTHDKPYTFGSNLNKRIGILVEDANGNWIPLEQKNKGNQTLGNCSDPDAISASHFVYCGWSVGDVCFNNPTSSLNDLYFSWYLYLPEDVNITNDATCVGKGKIGPYGFATAPTGTGYRTLPYTYTLIGTEVEPVSGETMKKWKIVTNPTPFTQGDYCINQTLLASVKVKTDCSELGTYIQPVQVTDNMEINSLQVPDLYMYGHSNPGRIEFIPNTAVCGNDCHGYYKWCTMYKVQYRLVGASAWAEFISPASDVIVSFEKNVSSSTYQIRYKGLIKGTWNGADAVWSDWKTPAATVVVP
jgi:hypothetical protein